MMTTQSNRKKNKLVLPGIVAAVVFAALIGFTALRGGEADAYASASTFEVRQGALTISVLASGNLRAAQSIAIKNETERRTTIVYLVEEGTIVEEGELLVELDVGDLEDEQLRQEIQFEQARSEFVQAESNLEVVRQQAEADIAAAEVAYQLAKLDLEMYQSERGQYEQDLREAETNITIAEAELERADEQLRGSSRLFEAGYITETELQADELTYQRRRLDLELARGRMNLLEQFTRTRRLAELNSDVDQKRFELAKVKHRTQADTLDAEARLSSRQLSFQREEDRLERMRRQIEACRIYAPVGGMVVHGTSGQQRRGNQEPLAEGVEVHPRQDLILLPTADRMVAEIKIHEAMIDRVQRGMPVKLETDALPGRTFEGVIRRIAVMPDAQNMWLNPDLKVYNTDVEIIGDASGLRTGMSCSAEIIVAEINDATYVPIQSVMRVDGEHTVYLPSPQGPQPRSVKVGMDNTRMIQVVSGLSSGDRVLLDPPLAPSRRSDDRERETPELETLTPQTTERPAESPAADAAARPGQPS